jgi:hypothetical protein
MLCQGIGASNAFVPKALPFVQLAWKKNRACFKATPWHARARAPADSIEALERYRT